MGSYTNDGKPNWGAGSCWEHLTGFLGLPPTPFSVSAGSHRKRRPRPATELQRRLVGGVPRVPACPARAAAAAGRRAVRGALRLGQGAGAAGCCSARNMSEFASGRTTACLEGTTKPRSNRTTRPPSNGSVSPKSRSLHRHADIRFQPPLAVGRHIGWATQVGAVVGVS